MWGAVIHLGAELSNRLLDSYNWLIGSLNVTEAVSWSQDDQNKSAMVRPRSAMEKVLYSEDMHTEKCPKIQTVMNGNHHNKASQILSAWLMWSNYQVIEYELVNQLNLEAVIQDNK